MKLRFLTLCVLWILAGLVSFGADAHAQLFSWGSSKSTAGSRSSASVPLPRYSTGASLFSRWNPFSFSANRSYRSNTDTSEGEADGSYRTLCVRLCDGYYFPISYRASRSRMYHDSKICEASCDCETRLYYLPSSSSDIAHMTDLTGLSYGQLETAFEYRSVWNESCSCRPAAWSMSEKVRHDEYAQIAADQKAIAEEQRIDAAAQTVLSAMKETEPAKPIAPIEEQPIIAATAEGDGFSQPETKPAETPLAPPAQANVSGLADGAGAHSLAPAVLEPVPAEHGSGVAQAQASEKGDRQSWSIAPGSRKTASRSGRASSSRQSKPASRGFFQL